MKTKHTRDPGSLSYDDYLYWSRFELLKWLSEHIADADFPTHIVGDLSDLTAKIDAYETALTPYGNLIELTNGRNKLYSDAADNTTAKLQQIKTALPTIAPDPIILAEFNLAGPVPKDREKLYLVTKNALAHWADVSADPLFTPMVPDFTTLTALFADLTTTRDNYIDTDDQREATQNLVLSTREAIHVIERETFTWYRSRHPDGKEEWWTNTPWGRTGQGEEPSVPLPPWPGPAAVTLEYIGSGVVEIGPELIEDMVDGIIERRKNPADPWDKIAGFITIEDGAVIPFRDLNAPDGNIEYRFTPKNEAGEDGLPTIESVKVD